MKPFFRNTIGVAALALLATSCGGMGKKKNLPGPNDKVYSVSAATVLSRDIPDVIEIKGSFTATQRLIVKSEFTGKVQALSAIEGQTVAIGDALLKIEDEKLPYILDKEKAELKEAEAQLDLSGNRVAGSPSEDALEDESGAEEEAPALPIAAPPEPENPPAEPVVPAPDASPGAEAPVLPIDASPSPDNKRANFLRNRLLNRGPFAGSRRPTTPAVPPANLEQHENRIALDQARIDRLKAEIALTEKQITSGTIQSPMEGFVAKVSVAEGSLVQINDVLMEILDVNPIELTLKVPKDRIGQINKSLEVKVTSPDLPGQSFTGEISFIGAELDPQTKTLEVRVRIANPDGKIKVGMEGIALMAETGKNHPALMVPPSAILSRENKKYIYVVHGQIAEREEVEVGSPFEGWVEIKSGVKKGEQVVTRGAEQLKEEEEFIKM